MSKVFFMCGTIIDLDFDAGRALVERGYGKYPGKDEPQMRLLLQEVLGHDEVGILAYPTYEQWRGSEPSVIHQVIERMQPHDPFTGEPM